MINPTRMSCTTKLPRLITPLILPWTVTKKFHRDRKPSWLENDCSEKNHHVAIGKDNYFLSADGYLMPTKKGQMPPDLRYFSNR